MGHGEVIIVTGANGGIGQALVLHFKESGYYVVGTDLGKQKCEANYYTSCDLDQLVRSRQERSRFYSEVISDVGSRKFKALINNAAVQKLDSLESLQLEDLQNTININTIAPVLLSKMFLEELSLGRGTVINIGSIHSKLTKPRFISYAISKAALEGVTRSLAVDIGEKVKVNMIQPAAIKTDMLVAGFEGDVAGYQLLESFHPVNRIGQPSEVGIAAEYLISDKCPFLNGVVLSLDGGIGCQLHDPG